MSQDSQRASQDIHRPKTPALKHSSPKLGEMDEQRVKSDSQARRGVGPLEDSLANPFVPFLQEQVLVAPYHSELSKDAEFQERLCILAFLA